MSPLLPCLRERRPGTACPFCTLPPDILLLLGKSSVTSIFVILNSPQYAARVARFRELRGVRASNMISLSGPS